MNGIKKKAYNILRWSEKYTNTDMIYLAKGGGWLSVGHIISMLSALLIAVAFANLLPKEVYGTYKFIISVSSILMVATLSGINSAIHQAVSRDMEGSVIYGARIKIKWGIFSAIGGLILALYYYINGNNTLSLSFLLLSFFLPFLESFAVYESYLQGKKLFKQTIKYLSISRIITVGTMVATIFLTDNIFLIVLAYFLPWTLIRMILYKRTLKLFPPNNKVDKTTISYGKHLSLVGFIGTISAYLDNLLIFHFLGAVPVAVYTFAFAPIEQIRAGYKNISLLSVPKLSNRTVPEINRLFKSRLIKLTLIGILIGGTYAILAPYLYKLIFPQYMEAVLFSQLLAIILVIRLPLTFISSAVHSKLNETPKSWLYWRSINSVILVIALIILTPMYGIIGAVLSRIIFAFTQLIVVGWQWRLFTINSLSKSNS
jgi:O-antigen/teichoic acid export membrane protein